MPLRDTSPEAREIQLAIYRRLSGAQRLTLAFEMSLLARDLSMTRLRRQHPEWSPAALRRELLRYALLPASLPESIR